MGWRITLFLVVAILVTAVAGVFLPGGVQGNSLALLLGAMLGGWSMLALDGRSPDALGFHVDGSTARESALGLALGVGIALTVVAVMAALGGVRWVGQDGTWASWARGGGAALLWLTLPAAMEEAMLRGYPLQALSEAVGPKLALLATSATFATLHYGNPEVTALGLANVGAAGLLLGAVYLKTGSLWWATGVHLGWNWAHGYVVDLPVSGLELLDAPFYDGVPTGVAWIGGGAFGPEGSAVSTVALVGATVVVWRSKWLRPSAAALRAEALVFSGPNAMNVRRESEEIDEA